jgi:peptidyl-prolyl cis-trans isomerase D
MFKKISADELKKQARAGRFTFKTVVAFIVFGAIILVFVFFGFPTKQAGQLAVGYAATVNNSLISLNEFKNEASRIEQMYAPMFGGLGNLPEAQRQFLSQQALENLINREILSQSAQKAKVFATDEEVKSLIINEIPAFQRDGRFQREIYDQLLAANNLSKSDFESRIRKDQQTQRLRRLLEIGSSFTHHELEKAKTLKERKLNFSFVRIDKQALSRTFNVEESVLKAQLTDSGFKSQVDAYYLANKKEFSQPEQVKASHLLIKFNSENVASEQAALVKINKIKAQLTADNFATVASKESQDEGSKAKGGDLGYFERGKMMPEFEKAAFSQKVGEVGPVVKSAFGYHLIKVTDRKQAAETPKDQVENLIAKKLIQESKASEFVKSVETVVKDGALDKLEPLLSSKSLKWNETGFFDLEVESIPQTGIAMRSIVADMSSSKPLIGRVIHENQAAFILKLKDFKTEKLTNIDSIKNQLQQEMAMDVFNSWLSVQKKSASIFKNNDLFK